MRNLYGEISILFFISKSQAKMQITPVIIIPFIY